MKVNMIVLVLFAFLILCFLVCCEKDMTPLYSVTDEYKYSLIPAYPGNSWTYADTLFESNKITVNKYTIKIEDFLQDNDKIWWKINWGFANATLSDSFVIRSDSIFKNIALVGVPTQYKQSLEFFYFTGDSVTFFPLQTTDGMSYKRVGKKIDVPVKIGNRFFKNCLSFTAKNDEYIIYPGIGIISHVYKYDQYTTRKARLIDYHLSK